jgi:alkaline phosphatase
LAKATYSSEYLDKKLSDYLGTNGANKESKKQRAYVREEILKNGLGIEDASEEEVDTLFTHDPELPPKYILADMISRRAQIGWSTHGHSGKLAE